LKVAGSMGFSFLSAWVPRGSTWGVSHGKSPGWWARGFFFSICLSL
jgi:hypothetical protein